MWRTALLWFLLFFVGASGWLFFSDTFRIQYVLLDGNRFLSGSEIERAARSYADRPLLWVLPRTNYFFFSTRGAERAVTQALQNQQAMERLEVKKKFPISVLITVVERVPHAVYINGGHEFLIDRSGYIASQVEKGKKPSPHFPVVYDQTTRSLKVGSPALSEQLVIFLFALQKELEDKTDIAVQTMSLPPVTCLALPEEPAPKRGVGATEDNTNARESEASSENADTNATNTALINSSSLNTNSASAAKKSSRQGNDTNVNTSGEKAQAPDVETCDKERLALRNLELRVKTTEKWEAYFRADDAVERQVSRLVRLLREKNLDRTTLKYVDLRFGDQVIYK